MWHSSICKKPLARRDLLSGKVAGAAAPLLPMTDETKVPSRNRRSNMTGRMSHRGSDTNLTELGPVLMLYPKATSKSRHRA